MLRIMTKNPDTYRVVKYDGSFESIQHIRSITSVVWQNPGEDDLFGEKAPIQVHDPMHGYVEVAVGMNLVFAADHINNFAMLTDKELAIKFSEVVSQEAPIEETPAEPIVTE